MFKRHPLAFACLMAWAGLGHAASTIDLVVAMDESGSMSGEHNAFIGSYIQNLDNILNNQGVTVNQYGLTGFGLSTGTAVGANEAGRENGSNAYRHFFMTLNPSAVFGTPANFSAVTPQLRTSGGTEDGYRTIDYILRNYQFRGNAGASILLITDEDRDNDTGGTLVTNNLPAGDTQFNRQNISGLLQQNRVVVHGVVNQRFRDVNGNPAIAIVGADPATGFAFVRDSNTGLVTKRLGYQLGAGSGTTQTDYTEVALATGGTVADIDQLRSVYQDLPALQSLSQELAQVVAAISQGQVTVVGIDCSIARGPAASLCASIAKGNPNVQQLATLVGGNAAGAAGALTGLVPHNLRAAIRSTLNGGRSLSHLITTRVNERRGSPALRSARDGGALALTGGSGSGVALSGAGPKGGAAGADSLTDAAWFVRGNIGESKFDTTGGFNGYRADTYAVALGADKRINAELLLGAAFGYTKADSQVANVASTGSESDTYSLSAFASYQFMPGWYVDAVAGYGAVKFDTRRNTVAGMVTGSTRGDQWNLSVGVATDVKVSETVVVQPFARLHYGSLQLNGYTESGGVAALTYGKHREESTATEIGASANVTLGGGWTGLAGLSWEHDFDPEGRAIRTAFVADPTNVFNVQGTPSKKDFGRLQLGLSKDMGEDRVFSVRLDSVVAHANYRDNVLEFKYRQAF